MDTNPRSKQDPLYFAIAISGSGRTIKYKGFKDKNGNGKFDPRKDSFIGTATARSLDGIVYNSGTFVGRGSSYEGFVGSKRVSIGYMEGDWFD